MRRSIRVSGIAAAVAVGALVLAGAPGSLGATDQNAPAANGSGVHGDGHRPRDEDHRRGKIEPTARQRDLAQAVRARARWNNLGTPGVLASTGRPLGAGLPDDPVAAARAYVAANRELLGLTPRAVGSLDVVTVAPMGDGAAVLLQERFGDLPAGYDGLLVIGVRAGEVFYVSGSLARDTRPPAPATLSADEAAAIAARDAGVSPDSVQSVELVAVPTPAQGARSAYHVLIIGGAEAEPTAFSTYVDARDGSVLVRDDLVDSDVDNPEWEVFPNTPPVDYSSADTRVRWCFGAGPGCDEVVGTPASPLAWDVKASNLKSSESTSGNNSFAVHNWFTNDPFDVGKELSTSATRDYVYPWTNQWFEEKCSPAVFETAARNDIDAARANLFAMHNRMHDWSYHLGFTETAFNLQDDNFGRGGKMNDPEQGNAQAGGVTGGPPAFAARDNANQITPPDGHPPITNMYLWQPIAGAFYAPCVDGDFDMSVIGHEYTHAISNRMVAGPRNGLAGPQAGAMGESWSDLMAMEYVNEHGYAPAGVRAFTIGEYVTSDPHAGIRSYNMSDSPLNYSDIAYDLVGQQVHADGEIWSATNFDIRQAFDARYGAGNAALQKACANGTTVVTACPGNRRWAQLVFDAWLLMAQSRVSMVDARDAMLAADMIRFGGANQDLLWNAFAARGLGDGAVSNTNADPNPTPSFVSPFADEATVTFAPVDEGGAPVAGARLFLGHYQARAVPVADTVPGALTNSVALVPGTYEFVAQAPGRGLVRVGPVVVSAGQALDLTVTMPTNLASAAAGATATGDGVNVARLIDDDEATNWASSGQPVAGRGVNVDLAGGAHEVTRVQVSAMLRPAITGDPDPGGQSRFSALRQFRVLACVAGGSADCSDAADFTEVFVSPAAAFPSIAPRPRAPELILRSFDIPSTTATHLRFEAVTNQCTGAPDYAGEQDADPRAGTDCTTNSAQARIVRAAEFQVFTE
ncbi:peptidase M36 [Jiangella aurantiaca]|uniref:Peptidase M36 n=1 Tax=Jiangella aurantiaca TaxID=2530373 RepID=A0A4R5A0P2_9ACTN|nr:M36 family metallopeptidase [Jiangella aurantiaca]TDD64286.1 peptidase M36 [Jiangella aurantiaca]